MVPYPIGRMRLTSHPIQFLHSHPRPFAMRYLAGFALLASHRTLLRGLPNGRGLQRWRKVCEGCKDGYRIGSMASYYINIYICVILCTYIYLYLYIYLFDTLYPITFNVCEDTHIHFSCHGKGSNINIESYRRNPQQLQQQELITVHQGLPVRSLQRPGEVGICGGSFQGHIPWLSASNWWLVLLRILFI